VPSDEECRKSELPEKVTEFRNELLDSEKIIGFFDFEKISEFKLSLIRSIENLCFELQPTSKLGWVRAKTLDNYIPISQVPPQIISSSAMRSLSQVLCNAEELFPNIDQCLDEKKSISRKLLDFLSVPLCADNGIKRIFIDGGSTTYYFCQELNRYFGTKLFLYHHKTRERLTLGTNSILNFIELSTNIQGSMKHYKTLHFYPAPPVNENYGKSFGTLSNVVTEMHESYQARGWQLGEVAQQHLNTAIDDFSLWLNKDGGYNLSIISAAGLSLSGSFQGPWVKSHASMLLQQGIFKTRNPVAFLLDGEKWGKEPLDNNGFRVLFEDFNWMDALSNIPICIATATFDDNQAAEMEAYFENHSVEFKISRDQVREKTDVRDLHRIVAYNNKFSKIVGY